MADDPIPTFPPMDWGTAQIHAGQFRNFFRAFEEVERVLATAAEAKHWLEVGKQDVEKLNAQVADAKKQVADAQEAVKVAKRIQAASEQAAEDARRQAQAEVDVLATRQRETENTVTAIMAQGQQAEKDRQSARNAAHEARLKELTTDLDGIQKEIARTKRVLAELRSQPIGA